MANTLAVVIEGIFGVDGRYEIDANYFTSRELHLIKEISGVRAGELTEAMDAGDSDLVVAISQIALMRHGKAVPIDVLWDAPAGHITLLTIDPPPEQLKAEAEAQAEEDALPPTSEGDEPSSES